MRLQIRQTLNKELIKDIVTNPGLFALAGYIGDPSLFRPNLNNVWLEVQSYGITLGLFELREITKIAYDAHIYILPQYQRDNISVEAADAAKKWIKNNTYIRSVIIQVPEECKHVHRYMKRIKSKVCGLIHEGIIYKDKLQNILLYQLMI